MSEWVKKSLGDFMFFQRGHDLSRNNMKVGNIPVAGSNGVIGFHNASTTIAPGITIGRSGNIGTPHFYQENFWAHNTVLYVKDFKGNDPLFCYYLLKTIDFSGFNTGSAVPTLNRNHIHEHKINTPPVKEQKAIASVLSSLDNKIDLLHRQNKTVESMAETLFRQWFADDSNGSGKEVELHEVIEFNPKRVLPKGSKAMYLEMAGLNTNTFAASGYYERDFTSGQKFIKQDTLLARITPCLENGKAGYVHFLSPEQVGWGSTEFIVLRPKPKFHPLFSYILCRNNEFKEYAESCMEGSSGRQRVNVSHLSMYTLTLPHDDVITQFNEILASIEPKLISNALQIQTLENLRDTLLSKLMSGEVRVSYTPEEIKQ
ncbi:MULTISPECIES: restriction endonuclease subunit S [Morganellaceae]|uniref:restriction endonuclease subunit S n=1 Tax=Morganellaceae TaxID=1903414 RepID=UPI0015EB5242|nr:MULTISPECIES: restriction endonuclease subunit S [Morganellaceae]MBT0422756.1 restriction endonuclease subunit S [Morganella morganii subsp. morganii]MBT0517359.1 restriction endonuclease subunit S [Morganella morganii subsp. morganii]QLQ96724.1 restriction endonuclease subunit S [Providencia alcalifaciens]QWM03726.1 restriction endonuclease subunit S [Morganella morganii subsp. morganii]